MDKNTAINKHKKLLKRLKISTFCLFILLLLIEIIIINLFKDLIVASIIVNVVVLIAYSTIGNNYVNKKREEIIDKYYEKVTNEDKEIANKLLEKEELLLFTDYDFLKQDCYSEYDHDIKLCLNEISIGNKVEVVLCQLSYKIKETISNNLSLYNNKEYNNYIFEIVELLKRNSIDF